MAFLKTDIQKFYASTSVRHFGLALISIFVPAYLFYELHFPIQQVMGYFFLEEVFNVLLLIFLGPLMARYGARKSVIASVPFAFLLYLLLPLASDPLILLVTAACEAVYSALYWPFFHVYIARLSEEHKIGAATGRTWFWLRLTVLFGPFVGGILLQYAGYYALCTLLVALLIASAFVLPDSPHGEKLITYRKMWARVSAREKFSWMAEGVTNEAGGVLWPLYSFTILGSFALQGAFVVAGGLFSAGFTWWLGQKADYVKKEVMLRYAWLAGAVAWLFRSAVNSATLVVPGQVAGDSCFAAMETPIVYKVYYEGRAQDDLLSRVMLREMILRVPAVFVLGLAAILPLQAVFVIIGLFFAASAWAYR